MRFDSFIRLIVFAMSLVAGSMTFVDANPWAIQYRASEQLEPVCRPVLKLLGAGKRISTAIAKPASDILLWYSAGHLKDLSADAMNVFVSRYHDENFKITQEQKALLESKGYLEAYEYFDSSPRYGVPFVLPSQFWSMKRAVAHRARPIDAQYRVLRWMPRAVRSGLEMIALAVLPPALFLRLVFGPPTSLLVERVYRKVLNDPNYILTEREQRILRALSLEKDIERYRQDSFSLAKVFRFQDRWRSIKRWALSLAIATSLIAVSTPSMTISTQESFSERSPNGMSRYDEKVELIFLHPMPHVALRIGGVVYNFSIGYVDKMSLRKYRESMGFSNELSGSHTRIELEMSASERRRLIMTLNQRVGQAYLLFPPFNDCVSQTNLALHEVCPDYHILPGANRSQALTIAQLRLQNLLGDARIKKITYGDNKEISSQKLWTHLAVWAELATFARYTLPVALGGEVFDAYGAPSWNVPPALENAQKSEGTPKIEGDPSKDPALLILNPRGF